MQTVAYLPDSNDPPGVRSFEWLIDPNGYDLGQGLGTSRIRRRGGALVEYRVAAVPALHRQFSEIKDAAGALEFVQKYGFPDAAGHGADRVEEPVSEIVAAAGRISFVLDLYVDSAPEHGIDPLHNADKLEGLPGQFELKVGLASSGKRELRLIPRNLLSWLWAMVGQEIAHGRQWRLCEICKKPIRIGEGGSRSDRETCSSACMQKLWRRRKKEAEAIKPKYRSTRSKKGK